MDDPYEKVAFQWEEPRPLVEVPARLSFRPVSEVGLPALTRVVSLVMAESHDRNDKQAVAALGADEAAARFVASAREHFDYDESWWQVGFSSSEAVGFVQPVTFRGYRRGELEEGTIFYMGVVPEQRGRGYGRDLLCRATRTLQEVGVWRIFCDTDVRNAPMIRLFEAAGFVQSGGPQAKPFWRL
jgi:ribosomal protein S18 acetylase RimI-like enzyme